MTKPLYFALLLAMVVTLVGPRAEAERPKDAAKRAYARAETHYAVGEFPEAVREYKRAYELSKAPALLFNIAQALRLSGELEDAKYFYETYLRLAKRPANRRDVEKKIRKLSKQIDQEAARDAQRRSARAALAKKRQADAERRRLEAEAKARQAREQEARAEAELARARGPRRKQSSAMKWGGLTIAAVGVLATGAGVYMGLEARSEFDEVNSTASWSPELDDTLDSAQSKRTASIVLSSAGATAVVGGTVLYLLGRRGFAVAEETSVAIGPSGASFAMSWRFP